MGNRIVIFLLCLPFFAVAQTTDVKDIQVAKMKLQIGTDASKYLNEIVQTISVASTHVQSPTAKAVWDLLGSYLTTVNLTFTGTSSPVTLANSGGTDVTFTSGTAISLSASPGNITITNSNPDQTVVLTQGGIVTISGTYPNFTISATEVDGSTTNEIQTYGHSGTTSYTNTLSLAGGSFTLNGGTGITLAHSGGTTTITNSSPLTTGTQNYFPKWGTGGVGLTSTSLLFDNGTNVGVGTASPGQKLDVLGNIQGSADLYLGTGFKIYDGGNLFFHKTGSTTTNMFLGYNAGGALTATGVQNIGIGNAVMYGLTSGNSNFGGGNGALQNVTSGSGNVCLAGGAGFGITTGSYNFIFGAGAGSLITTQSGNVAMGFRALHDVTNGYNIGIGYQSLDGTNGTETIAIGTEAGASASAQTNSTLIGRGAGWTSTANTSVFIGYAAGYGNTTNNTLAIDYNPGFTANKAPLIGGNFSTNRVGVNTLHSSLAQTLHVTGTARITGSDGTPTTIMGRDADGDISSVTIGAGLALSGGTLLTTGTATAWINGGNNFGGTPSIGNNDAAPLLFETTNIERARITAAGAMQIGVSTTAAARLEVGGITNTVGILAAGGSVASGTALMRATGTIATGFGYVFDGDASNAGGNIISRVRNSSNTASSNAIHQIVVAGTTASDPFTQYQVEGANTWSVGVSNANADKFCITPDVTPALSAIGFQMLTTGESGFSSSPSANHSAIWGLNKPLGLPSGTSAGRALGTNSAIWYNSTILGTEIFCSSHNIYKRLTSNGTPTTNMVSNSGVGASAVLSSGSNDMSGQITFTVGSSGILAGNQFEVQFAGSFSGQIFVDLQARNSAMAAQLANVFIGAQSTSSFFFTTSSALGAGSILIFNYRVTQ